MHYIAFSQRNKPRSYAVKYGAASAHSDHTDLNCFIVLFYARIKLAEWNFIAFNNDLNTYEFINKPYKIENT